LILYYTDVLDLTPVWGGVFVTAFPLVSKLFSVLTTIWIGRIIDRTNTRQGKARPWLLVWAPLMVVTAIAAVAVPNAPEAVQLIWIVLSYALLVDFALVIWGTSNGLMVPLASRRPEERGPLAVLTNMSIVMFASAVVSLAFPLMVLPAIGASRSGWLIMMVCVTLVALPLMVLQYFFTRERVTEQSVAEDPQSLKAQYKTLFTSKFYVLYVTIWCVYVGAMTVRSVALIYYCNYVLGEYNDGITPTLLQAVAGAPLALGLIFVWPLAKRFGKRNVTLVGLVIAVVGSVITLAAPSSLPVVLIGQGIMNLGTVPAAFVFSALLGDVLDHIEWKRARRVDGAAMSTQNVMLATLTALGTALFTYLLSASGEYRAPSFDEATGVTTGFEQSPAIQGIIVFCFAGITTVVFAALAIAMTFLNVERDLPAIQRDLARRAGDKQEEPVEESSFAPEIRRSPHDTEDLR
jgi:GPH family glycoside/pentoside/hexuronide:cation symporter